MKTKLALATLIAGFGLAGAAASVSAATATGQFNVKLTVTKTCSVVTTTDLDFGTQASTATNITANNGSVTVACSKNTPYTIGLLPSAANGGTANGTGSMKSATTGEPRRTRTVCGFRTAATTTCRRRCACSTGRRRAARKNSRPPAASSSARRCSSSRRARSS